jgi:hypothetical protein
MSAFMPLSQFLVFVSQFAAVLTTVAYYIYWSHDGSINIQMGIMAVLPRALLCLGCTAFAMHQQRFLNIIMKEDSLIKEATHETYKNRMLGLLNSLVGNKSPDEKTRYYDMESPSQASATSSDNCSLHSAQSGTHEDIEGVASGGIAVTLNESPAIQVSNGQASFAVPLEECMADPCVAYMSDSVKQEFGHHDIQNPLQG